MGRFCVPLAVCLSALTFAGCDSTPKSASTSTVTATACSVVSRSDAAGAIGHPVKAGVSGTSTVAGGSACVFYGPAAPNPPTPDVAQRDSVRVGLVKGARAQPNFKKDRDAPDAHFRSISGYGEQAFSDGAGSLHMLEGDTYVQIAVITAGNTPSLSGEEKLATALLHKLKR